MPTERIYKKVLNLVKDIEDLGLNGWQTELTITDRKKGFHTDVKVNIQLKKQKIAFIGKTPGKRAVLTGDHK